MLSRLIIKNFAIIDELTIQLSPGLNIITGETGAGKSILVGALSLLLGQRADTKTLFKNEVKCSIEGTFQIGAYSLKGFFEDNDLDYEEESILRREITSEGKSRAFINDSPVTLSILKELGYLLVDIHSQHETLDINTEAFQVKVLDLVAAQMDATLSFRNALKIYNKEEKKLKDMIAARETAAQETEYLKFQLDELKKAAFTNPEEQIILEQELEKLSHAEEIQKGLQIAFSSLEEDEFAAVIRIKEALQGLGNIEKFHIPIPALTERLKSIQIELRDINAELESLSTEISTDPERLMVIQERLNLIFSLQQKHRKATLYELIAFRDQLVSQLDEMENSYEDILTLQKSLKTQKDQLDTNAKQLSEARKKIIPVVEQEICTVLASLGMPDASFKIEQRVEASNFNIYGIDKIRFLFSANKGFEPGDLSKVASGGELSRLMLSIKSLSSRYMAMPTVIFDEIDTGVSGEVAMKVGRVMESLSTSNQVIAITHLPQIASRGTAHFFVYKDIHKDITHTNLRKLENSERVNEIAKMLSGNDPGEFALKNARELLSKE